jgi:hypothetical protein
MSFKGQTDFYVMSQVFLFVVFFSKLRDADYMGWIDFFNLPIHVSCTDMD